MKFEFKNELSGMEREKIFTSNDKIYGDIAKEMFEKYHYSNPIVLKNLKKHLPLRVSLFNKITIYGMTMFQGYIIEYSYFFNDNIDFVFAYRPSLNDMRKWG